MPDADLLVVDDGSRDGTSAILRELRVVTATHLCNLGYGRAIQTALKYALAGEYGVLVTLDADGQHRPVDVRAAVETFHAGGWDAVIGSRYATRSRYDYGGFGRRVGMRLFSTVTGLVGGCRIYDTTSGLRILGRRVLGPLTQWHFVDFHAEAIVYLLRLGFRVGEHPVTVEPRTHGRSMYSAMSFVVYPSMTLTMISLALVQASITKRRAR
jgi:glycosyltransferase involved in cell wall biosynthesis